MSELGDFLRSRRAAVTPEEAGVTSYGARRVPGLRREELAHLAGVSPTYYTRLEQASAANASDAVIDALARALRLSDDEHDHLRRLARPSSPPTSRTPPPAAFVRPSQRAMIMAMPTPAAVLDHASDVLAWNPLMHRLIAGHLPFGSPDDPDTRPNIARQFFLDPHDRELYVDWCEIARDIAAYLRFATGRHPEDLALTQLVGELTVKSEKFAQLWGQQLVQDCGYGTKRFQHPVVGRLDLDYEVMKFEDSAHRAVVYFADAGSAAEASVRMLADQSLSPRLTSR